MSQITVDLTPEASEVIYRDTESTQEVALVDTEEDASFIIVDALEAQIVINALMEVFGEDLSEPDDDAADE